MREKYIFDIGTQKKIWSFLPIHLNKQQKMIEHKTLKKKKKLRKKRENKIYRVTFG